MRARRSLAALFVLAAAGCGASTSTPRITTGKPTATQLRDVASPKVCLPKRRLLEAMHQEAVLEKAYADAKPEPAPAVNRTEAPSIGGAYATVAPATVLIRTHEAMGSGVIIDKRGLVLTNHHVVDEFLQPDLTIKVTLELNQLGPTGRVERSSSGKTYTGVVVKSDPVKDIALVKIDDPPPDLPVARLADVDPEVGEEALSIGNAGIGLLWAAKACSISKIGDVSRETSMLHVADCSLQDPGADPEESARDAQQCEARKKEIKEDLERAAQGLAIQTTCNLNGGDSGGPLVNAYGEIIGLNQSIRFGGSSLAFHVHVAELRAFLDGAGVDAATVVPDPWCEGGLEPIVEDDDGDGSPDVVLAQAGPSFRRHEITENAAYLIDLDGAKTAPSLARPFGAEVAVLLKDGAAYAFYDDDGDGEFDTLLRDRKADGKPETAFRLHDGHATVDASLLTEHTIDTRKFSPAAVAILGERVGALGLSKLSSPELVALGKSPRIPDWRRSMGHRFFVTDTDGDGDGDTLMAANDAAGPAFLIDVSSPALAKLKSGDDGSKIFESGDLHPAMVTFSRPNGRWALYDSNADGTLDLALFAQKVDRGADDDGMRAMMFGGPSITTFAVRIGPGGDTTPEPMALGRDIDRTDLLPKGKSNFWGRRMGRQASVVRADLPDPRSVDGWDSKWQLAPLDGERQVLSRTAKFGASLLVDVDRDTKKITTSTPEELADGTNFDAEFALRREDGKVWAYYDTDGDGVFDHVYFSLDGARGTVDNAIITNGTGDEIRSDSAAKSLFRPELLKLSAAGKKALEKVFSNFVAQ